jgi:hypothetical protein
MTLGLAFWILMLIWFVFGVLVHSGWAAPYGAIGNMLLLFVLFLLLGWKVFGAPLHG